MDNSSGIIISYHGPPKSGKTTFGFTGPKPLVHLDFDLGRQRAIHRFKDVAGQILTYELPEPPNWMIGNGQATQLWERFMTIYNQALQAPLVKSIFLDTGTQCWKVNTQEYLENYVRRNNAKRTQLSQIEYRVPNDRMRSLILAARTAGKIMLISHYEADDYVEQFVTKPDGSIAKESVKTGYKVPAGFNDMRYLTDFHLYTYIKRVPIANGGMKLVPCARVEEGGWMPLEAIGMEIEYPTMDKVMDLAKGLRGN